jgi:hypothetical protein
LGISFLVFAGCKSEASGHQRNDITATPSAILTPTMTTPATSTPATNTPTSITPTPSVSETQAPPKNEEIITKEDENAVHDVIVSYFKAIENKDYAAAWEMFSSETKKSTTKNDAVQNHFGMESVKLISIQTYLRPQEPKENENKPTIHFKVKLDIVPNQYGGAWGKGINERFVRVVKERGQWKINALATSP